MAMTLGAFADHLAGGHIGQLAQGVNRPGASTCLDLHDLHPIDAGRAGKIRLGQVSQLAPHLQRASPSMRRSTTPAGISSSSPLVILASTASAALMSAKSKDR